MEQDKALSLFLCLAVSLFSPSLPAPASYPVSWFPPPVLEKDVGGGEACREADGVGKPLFELAQSSGCLLLSGQVGVSVTNESVSSYRWYHGIPGESIGDPHSCNPGWCITTGSTHLVLLSQPLGVEPWVPSGLAEALKGTRWLHEGTLARPPSGPHPDRCWEWRLIPAQFCSSCARTPFEHLGRIKHWSPTSPNSGSAFQAQ